MGVKQTITTDEWDGKAGITQLGSFKFVVAGVIEEGEVVRVVINAEKPGTITKVTAFAAAGSGDMEVSINGTPLGGASNTLVAGTDVDEDHTSDNEFEIGDFIEVEFTGVTDLEDVSVNIWFEKTLEN